MAQTKDKVLDFFKKNLWVQNDNGDLPSTFNMYRNVLRDDVNQSTDEKFTPEDLVKRYRNYIQYKEKEKKEFIRGGAAPVQTIKEWLIQKSFQTTFTQAKIAIPERDSYLFSEGWL